MPEPAPAPFPNEAELSDERTDLLLNGMPAVSAVLTVPRIGAWVAECAIDAQKAPSGDAVLAFADGAVEWHGTVYRAGVAAGGSTARLVRGRGGLATELAPKFYRSVPLGIPLPDVLASRGEKLSPSSSHSVLAKQLPFWTRVRGTAGAALRLLAARRTAAIRPPGSPRAEMKSPGIRPRKSRPGAWLAAAAAETGPGLRAVRLPARSGSAIAGSRVRSRSSLKIRRWLFESRFESGAQ